MASQTKKPETKIVNPPTASESPAEVTSLAGVNKSAGLANAAPDWLKAKMLGQSPRGLEKMDKNDLIYPRLLLCQALTPAVIERKALTGDVVDNLTGEVIAKFGTRLQFIPIALNKARLALHDLKDGGGIDCRAPDAITAGPGGIGRDRGGNLTTECEKCIHKEFDDSKEKGRPTCTLFYNIIGVLPEFGMRPIVWSVKSSGVKVARRFLSIIATTNADMFAHKFDLFAVDAKSGEFSFQNWDFKQLGWAGEDEYHAAESFYTKVTGKVWSPDVTDIETHGEGDTSFPPSA